jgi:hypothetical protein
VGEKLHPTLEIDRFTIEFAGLEYAIWDLPFGMARVVMANLNFCKVVCQSVVSAVCSCVPCTQYRPIYIYMRFGSKGPNHSQRNAKKKFLLSRVLEEK